MYYFDNCATTFMSKKVLKAISNAPQGNSNSIHIVGREAKALVQKAEEKVKELIGAKDGQIIWTSGGTEANTLALVNTLPDPTKFCRIHRVGSRIEHASVYYLIQEKIDVTENGELKVDELVNIVNFTSPFLVSVMSVNNEIGVIQPIHSIAHHLKETNQQPYFHIDHVQGFGKIFFNVEEIGCDLVTLSAHKVGGPKGVGCLWLREGIEFIKPYTHTLNIPGIAGFLEAMKEVNDKKYIEYMTPIHKAFEDTLGNGGLLPELAKINGYYAPGVLGVFSITIPGISASELLLELDSQGMYVSAGSACHEGEEKPSHVLRSLGLTKEEALSTIRISLGKNNTEEEVIEGARLLVQTVKKMKGRSNDGPVLNSNSRCSDGEDSEWKILGRD